MLSRLRLFFPSNVPFLYTTAEAVLVGLFFIQALRYLIGLLYARTASASLYPVLDPALLDPTLPGLVQPATISNELVILALLVLLPLITLIAGRFIWLFLVAAAITALGRYLMVGAMETTAAALTVGGGLLYLALLTHHRARTLPLMFIIALGIDQLLRAFGNTLDPSWSAEYETNQLVLSIGLVILTLYNLFTHNKNRNVPESGVNLDRGLLTIWGGIGLGAMLFLQFSLLSLPNAIIGRTGLDYPNYVWLAPALCAATLLPLVPWVRTQARDFISLFDSSVRGWSWMLLIMLLIVLGTRLSGIMGGIALIAAQFATTMLWWWMVRPRAQKERNFSGFWIVLGMLLFGLLVVMDIFTYEYAFVRDFADDLAFLNDFIPPILRGFRGLGLAVLLLAVFMVVLPMSQMRRRIAWQGGSATTSALMLILVAGFSAGTYLGARPPVVQGVTNPDSVRVATYNIHAGYNEFFHSDLDEIALTIRQSGANVVLLQEVETGRMTSYGVDQVLWLARELNMDARFYPTNEGLQGLAVLSNIEIVFDDGNLLDSVGSQTGLQRVQVRPDAGVITLYNTWLDPLLDTGDADATNNAENSQQAQLSQIFGIISEHHPDSVFGRMIIGGTFNNVPDSDLIQRIRDNTLVDKFVGIPLEISATFWRTGQRARLDYLWMTPNVGDDVIGFVVVDTHASDHRLAVIEIDLR